MKFYKNCITLVLYFLIFKDNLIAQTIQNRQIKTYDNVQGNSLLSSRKIVKDEFGFLWIATQESLIRYHKTSPLVYSKNSLDKRHKLLGTDVSDITLFKNYVIALNVFDGINCINTKTSNIEKTIKFENNKSLFEDGNITRLAAFDSSVIFITTSGNIVSYNIFTNKYFLSSLFNNLLINGRIDIVKNIENSIFIGVSNGKILRLNKKLELIGLFDFNRNNHLKEIRCTSIEHQPNTNKIYIGTSIGLKCLAINDNNLTITSIISGNKLFANSIVYSVALQNNSIFYCTDYGLFEMNINDPNSIIHLQDNSKNSNNFYGQSYQIFVTNTHLLIASFNGLTEVKIEASAFSATKKIGNDISPLDHCIDLNFWNNQLWVSSNNGFLKYDLEKNLEKKFDVKNYILHLEKLPNNSKLICGTEGLKILENNSIIKASSIYKELNIVENYLIATSAIYNDSIIYFGAEYSKGIFKWDIKKHTLKPLFQDSVLNNIITNKLFIKNNTLFIVGEKKIIQFNLNTNQYKDYSIVDPNSHKEISLFMDMIIVKDKYWVAAYGVGLICLNNNFGVEKIIDNSNGILNLGLYKVFSIGDSLLITSSNNGLFTYNIRTYKVKTYFEFDGLHNNSFEEFSGVVANDKIIFGGLNGFTIVDPKLLVLNSQKPKIYFSNINVQFINDDGKDTSNLEISKIDIPNNYSKIKISFIGLCNLSEEQITYTYRIKELSNNWISLGKQNFIDLIGLSPGKYSFEVKATNEDGVESDTIKLTLHFLPKWYQTLFFKIIVILAIASLLYILYAFRIRQLKKIITVRKKISSDLHDDIGSTLSTINMYSQVAQLQPNSSQHINIIQENTKEALDKLDDIVWATNPKNDKIENLIERIENFAKPLLNAKQINFTFDYTNDIRTTKINEVTRQTLFLIIKEAINNTAKYAQAKHCTIQLLIKNKNILCTITDNGIGFDTTKPTERNGLLNMHTRTQALKGKFELKSEINKGTIITVLLPL